MSPPNVVYVITGERGSGKSTLCGWVAHEAGRRGHVVAGIVTEREGGADPVSTRRVVDLRSGEARLLVRESTAESRVKRLDAMPTLV